jgi:hypothetical protein
MIKYCFFSILIFSTILSAGDGWKFGSRPNPGLFPPIPNLSVPRPSALNSMIEDYLSHTPQHIIDKQVFGIKPPMFSSLPSVSTLTFAFNMITCVIQAGQEVSGRRQIQPQPTVVQQLPEDDMQADKVEEKKEIIESYNAVNNLSLSQLKALAELEEQEQHATHYFRNKYAATLKSKENK